MSRSMGKFGHLVQIVRDRHDTLFEATGTAFDATVLDRMLPSSEA